MRLNSASIRSFSPVLFFLVMPPHRGNRKTIADLLCQFPGCGRAFKTAFGLTRHVHAYHDNPTHDNANVGASLHPPIDAPATDIARDSPMPDWEPLARAASPSEASQSDVASQNSPGWRRIHHPFLTARPCDEDGVYLPEGAKPRPQCELAPDEWDPYETEVQFRLADFAFRKAQISGSNIDELMEIWALDKLKSDELAPFANADHLYETIDATTLGDAPWKCLVTDPVSTAASAPEWARRSYEIWYRDPEVVVKNLLDNPDFDGLFDYSAYVSGETLMPSLDPIKRRVSAHVSASPLASLCLHPSLCIPAP
ncbi:C2H2-type domain-containing protein [Mycena indigotica]|uniref:C2H2-type domain-containing protein n=1 Tax=Mycena indigotica TaxID=2126181 RepID=A0A8H6VZ54_9AGAR|nr:C2H2-type domain-containing protein [Mycena indigotica]KAF7299519.1 C2H2-type domain-containing protein [Mycena indigotica]